MLLQASIYNKTIANKQLFADAKITIEANEKVAIIGRNGVGKTTLFRMLTGEDHEYSGEIIFKKGIRVVATRQEHHDLGDQTVVDYIVTNLPDYAKLKRIIDTYPDTMGDNMRKIAEYSDALEQFMVLDYYTVEERVRRSLVDYQLAQVADRPMASLSGGQKRFVELIRVEHSDADLALIDEPTNHMDYVAKAAFRTWFAAVKHAVVVITHDRDLLQDVTRVIEIKDRKAFSFAGNYDAYLKQNTTSTAAKLHDYEVGMRTLENLHKQIQAVRAKKASTSKTPNPFIPLEKRLLKERAQLEAKLEKPSFWIDRESMSELRPKMEESYQKHKAKTIRIKHFSADERQRELLRLEDVQAGYDRPLFAPVSLRILTGDRVQLIGRNGVGKTTLVRTILQSLETTQPPTLLGGKIVPDSKLRINTYDQEVSESLLDMTLSQAIEHIYRTYGLQMTTEHIMRTLGDYLFDPQADFDHPVRTLSGGQKTRLQLIKLFANEPNLLILDEPTNHLDLPSIEELETALAQYKGALIYVSHDSYLAKHLDGEALTVKPL